MQVSKRFVVMFWCAYALTMVCGASAAMLFSSDLSDARFFVAGLMVLMFVLTAVLAYAFVHKLLVVHQKNVAAEASDQLLKEVTEVITRSSMLSFISLSLSMVTFILIIVYTFIPNVHLHFFYLLIGSIDLSSNTVCIFLTYKHFGAYYQSLCAVCDSQWSRCCMKLGTSEHDNRDMPRELTVTSRSASSL
eukprot:CAMPEP_0202718674 /NCGR_PEP_ID=MMETSP1385-20130828/124351_1 /ASSEMBLY_ACC=CAM_ASM_000861 /TAXON_ID=933848 /ORGANISM="Elphidium margaritaceum" /LENGTH=190 /DNA_ID=CAMNT_0049381503 /DNA_START=285 /DNA_END=857 /DNA_ORIENTATION=+